MVLACSRHMFVRPVFTMTAVSWVETHVAAFEFFGAVPARLVPDNLRTGVDRPDLYDPKINRAYGELAEHYGCLVDPARAFKPKDKARVERSMQYLPDSWWRGRTWESLDRMRTAATTWCTDVAGRRAHRSLDGAAPAVIFDTVERPAMGPVPHWRSKPRRGRAESHARLPHRGRRCAVFGALASHRRPRRRQTLPETPGSVSVDTQLVKTHERATRGRQTDMGDYPPEKIAFFQRTPTWCRHRATELGPNVTAVVDELLAVNALHRLRAVQGILGLADKHSPARLDLACARAVTVGDPTYRTIRGILAANTETVNQDPVTTAPHAPAHLHGPQQLFNPGDENTDDGDIGDGVDVIDTDYQVA